MAKSNKFTGPAARLPKGFLDTPAEDIRTTQRMLGTIREVYERYGFEPLETPAIEYTDALGKFLPDQDRPNEGVFSFQDEDEQWLSLRYDLTAPLARYVAENFAHLPKPFRRYAVGPVWRNEKPGPGRFRQFTQFDADTVGTDNIAADAEICMLAADTLEALGLGGKYVVKVSSRKVLDGLLESIGLGGDENVGRRLTVLRAIDKLDRLGADGVAALLGKGRRDESGDFTRGAELNDDGIRHVLDFLGFPYAFSPDPSRQGFRRADLPPEYEANEGWLAWMDRQDFGSVGEEGKRELAQIAAFVAANGFGNGRIKIDSSVVRGLEYYTGPVFEAELTFEVKNEDGQAVRFGSVGGGGRYDGLVERFLGTKVPATGFSIGVSRLAAALAALNKDKPAVSDGPVVVLVMEKDRIADYQRMAQALRGAGIRAEMYLGTAGMKAQMKYADKRGAPCVVIQGGEERTRGEVQIKDLVEGAKAAATIKDSKEWREGRPAQVSVKEDELVAKVREVLVRQRG
ncbi:MAG TPA: histidine--tRNA ligase [Hyphomicrobiaceae bacterium]|jgi:histidyl-tRNA synthetase|nr:histidine--tRNA ligase [Hyphomicrobiaceae bacterium]